MSGTLILSETRERFVRAIAGAVAPERIIEIHFFQPIRQAGIESGVAVVAAAPDGDAAMPDGEGALPDGEEALPNGEGEDARGAECIVPLPAAIADAVADAEIEAGLGVGDVERAADLADDLDIAEDVADAGPAEELAAPAPRRFTVYTATYRIILRGIDRGKWESSVVAEADAPLVTIDAVVRGVQRRSGDAEDTDRMTGDEVRSVVGG